MDRRQFLKGLGYGLVGLAGCSRTGPTAPGGVAAAKAVADSVPSPEKAGSHKTASVVLVTCEDWKSPPDASSLRRGLAAGIEALCGKSGADAWQRFFHPRDCIAIKVNCIAGPALSSSPALTQAIVAELLAAGHPPTRVWIYDRTGAELEEAGYPRSSAPQGVLCVGTDEVGYDEEVTVTGEVGTWFSMIVSKWASAIINVPVAKDHDLCGISGALKNHFGSIRNPNKLHYPDLSTAIADVAAAPTIARKQRLVIFDLLRVCYDGGPAYKPGTTKPYGAILLSTDPVAADTVVAGIIDELRKAAGMRSLWQREPTPAHLLVAADEAHSLGCANIDRIRIERVRV
ncbi:MAG: DUF362 domain-containing protein [Armatimonadetes bacterium]|nr:DUF362 domain-containing protein [Armatimonadota bacterium]